MSAVEYVYSSWCLKTKEESRKRTKLTTAKKEMYWIHEYLSTSETEGVYLTACSGMRIVSVMLNCLTEGSSDGRRVLRSASWYVGTKVVDTIRVWKGGDEEGMGIGLVWEAWERAIARMIMLLTIPSCRRHHDGGE